jgi:hypothetical protein
MWPHLLMALFGVGWAVTLEVGVRVYIAELIVIMAIIFMPWRKAWCQYPMARAVLGAFALWSVAIAIADLANATALFDFARNVATPILGGLSLLFALTALSRNPLALLTFLAATAVAKGVLGEPAYGDAFDELALSLTSVSQDSNFFKVRIDPFLMPAILLLACLVSRKGFVFAAFIFVTASVGYFLIDARSSGLVFFLSALALFAIHFRFRPKLSQMLVAGVGVIAVGWGAYSGYTAYTLNYNPSGHNARQLALMENPYDPVELLLQGRSEWLVMGTAVAERPLFGWGSWAVDKNNRFAQLRSERLGVNNLRPRGGASSSRYIPVHSVVGSAWVWSGLLGLIAMVLLFRTLVSMGFRLPFASSKLAPAAVFLAIMTTWHFFFSPPQTVRLFFPIALSVLIVITAGPRLNPRSYIFERGAQIYKKAQ